MASHKELALKKYKYWTLYLANDQYYLGRAYVWLKREGEMQRLSWLTQEERDELWGKVVPEYECVVEALFRPDHMNYAWLGNDFSAHKGHGHLHLIPRYAEMRDFMATTFRDEQWGHNYAPYPKKEYNDSLLVFIFHALYAGLAAVRRTRKKKTL